MTSVPEIDYHVLTGLARYQDPITIRQLAEDLDLDQAKVSAVCTVRAEQEIQLQESPLVELRLGKKLDLSQGFPDPQIVKALEGAGGKSSIAELGPLSGLDQRLVGQSLRFLKAKGWVEQQGKELALTDLGRQQGQTVQPDQQLVELLHQRGAVTVDQLESEGFPVAEALEQLKGRGAVDERERTLRRVCLSGRGRQLVEAGISFKPEVTQLTPELLREGKWREVELRAYDVTLPAEPVAPAKEHPLVSVFQQTRKVFLELGFEETDSGYVESSFWDFDALFQPQDHPARDMQDTFYVKRPSLCRLPDPKVVAAVGATHRDGGDTQSVGWRYDWSEDTCKKPVLRTHTTASTIRALNQNPNPPRKVFCVGPVFRRETVDYKHLPVFHQVDGIIIDEKATFANLLGTLQAFYRKMGFDKFQFRPAFFPYTEPSVEIFVWSESKKDWVEMGGAGMFRPEVTEPMGCKCPVLAWGLGLERLAMFRYQLSSIGELYRARIQWLKETSLCR